jgi:tRNA(fMet)-specific endonuclease VapC
MMYVLDTDTISLISRNDRKTINNLIAHEKDDIGMSAISCAELVYGLEKKQSPRLFAEVNTVINKMRILAFAEETARCYGKLRAALEKSGTPLSNMDMLIAASALCAKATLVSHNVKHFSKVDGIKVEDWS